MCSPLRKLGVANLTVIFYGPRPGTTSRKPLAEVSSADVVVDLVEGVWYFRKGMGDKPNPDMHIHPHVMETSFKIGTGVRVPENGEHWGPMMVVDMSNFTHRTAARDNEGLLQAGQLTE